MTKWITRWKYEIADKPTRPGIYRLKAGGYLVRCKVTNPRSGARSESMRALRDATLSQAVQELEAIRSEERARVRGKTRQRVNWGDFAISLMAERKASGKLASAATLDWWKVSLEHYLLPEFGHIMVDELDGPAHVAPFHTKVGAWIAANAKPSVRKRDLERAKESGEPVKIVPCGPRTVNGWLRIFRTICAAMTERYGLPRDPSLAYDFFAEGRAHTREQPNRLRRDVIPQWLATAWILYPQHYAMILLGFLLGVRPSHMRPLRKSGPNPDVLWKEGVLLIRRSNTRTDKVMDQTKTKLDQEIALPERMMAILKAHVDALPEGPMRDSEYLFPSITGGMRTRTVLRVPFERINVKLDLPHNFTPRGMRRTFNNSARQAGTHDIVTRSISGHQTEEMQRHYSLAEFEEQRTELEKILGSMLTTEESDGGERAESVPHNGDHRADEDAARGDGSPAQGGTGDEPLLGGRGGGGLPTDGSEAPSVRDAVDVRAPAVTFPSGATITTFADGEQLLVGVDVAVDDQGLDPETCEIAQVEGTAVSPVARVGDLVTGGFNFNVPIVGTISAGRPFFDMTRGGASQFVGTIGGELTAIGIELTAAVLLEGEIQVAESPTSAPTRGGEKGGNDSTEANETPSGRRDSNPRHQAWELGAEVKKTAFTENLLSQACSAVGELGQDLSRVGWEEGGEAEPADFGSAEEPPSRTPTAPWPWGPARRFRIEGSRVIRLADEPAIGGAL